MSLFQHVIAHTFQHTHSQFLVCHFTTAEAQGHFHFVAIVDKTSKIAHFHVVVALVSTGSEFYFFDLYDFLPGARFLLTLLFLVTELAVVHQPADWWICIGGYFDQINVVIFGLLESISDFYHAELFAFQAYESHFGDTDFAVDAVCFIGCDV